jgi:hypothetical protein
MDNVEFVTVPGNEFQRVGLMEFVGVVLLWCNVYAYHFVSRFDIPPCGAPRTAEQI